MSITASIQVDLTKLGRLTKELRPRLEDVVAVAAHNIERHAKDLVPVDTGATKSSIYVNIAGQDSSYSEGASGARSARPGVGITPEVKPEGEKGLAATIGPSTDYALALELGSKGRPARPFLIPSLQAQRGPFMEAVRAVFGGGGAPAPSGAMTWSQFVGERMGPYMKQYGGHAGAIKQIATEWKQYKAGR